MAFIRRGIDALESATLEQLQAAIVGLAENVADMITDCPNEETRAAVVMELVDPLDSLTPHQGR